MATKLTEKSTKNEIWAEYQRLLDELEGRPVAVHDDATGLQKIVGAVQELKSALGTNFDAALEKLTALQQTYHEADQALSQRKTAVLETLETDRKQLQATIEQVRAAWQQEQTDTATKRQREEDEYTYKLTVQRRDEQQAYDQKAKAREASLAEREAALKDKEDTLKALTTEVDAFPGRLENEVKSAREDTAKTMKAEHDIALKDARQTAEHEKSILALKLQTAEAAAASQTKQIADLQRQLDAAQAQLKDMAVTVIEANRPASVTTAQA